IVSWPMREAAAAPREPGRSRRGPPPLAARPSRRAAGLPLRPASASPTPDASASRVGHAQLDMPIGLDRARRHISGAMRSIPFRKMHGLGNDFVVLDARRRPLVVDEAVARALADRHTGIGCDQLIVIEPPRAPAARA